MNHTVIYVCIGLVLFLSLRIILSSFFLTSYFKCIFIFPYSLMVSKILVCFFNVCISMHIWSLGTKMTKILSTLGSYHLVRTIHIRHWYKTEWNKCWLKGEPLILVGNEGGCNKNSSIWAVPWREKAFFPKGSKGERENQMETCMRKGKGMQYTSCTRRMYFENPRWFCGKDSLRRMWKAAKLGRWEQIMKHLDWYCEKSQLHSVGNKEHGGVC